MDRQNKLFHQLAKSVIAQKSVSKEVSEYLFSLPRVELKKFVQLLRTELQKKTVIITTASELSTDTQHDFESRYSTQRVVYTVDENLGAGVRVQENDTIYEYSIKGLIYDTIQKLKE